MRCLHVNGYSQTDDDPYVRSLEQRMKDMKSEHLESSLTWRAELSMKQTEVERAKADLRHSMEREQVCWFQINLYHFSTLFLKLIIFLQNSS